MSTAVMLPLRRKISRKEKTEQPQMNADKEDSRPGEDKIIHNKVTKPRRENISQQGHKDRKDGPFEFLKSVFVAFAILL